MSPSTSRYVTLGAFFPPFPVGLLSYPGADRYRVSRCSFRGYKRCLFCGDCVSRPVFTPLLHHRDTCLLAGCKESYSARDFPVPVPQILRSRYDLGRASVYVEGTAGSQPQGSAEADPRWGTFKCVAGL